MNDCEELRGWLLAAVEASKRPGAQIRADEIGTRYQVSLCVKLEPIQRCDPSGGIDLWRLLHDLEEITADAFLARVIAFPIMEVEITGWVNAKPNEVGTTQIGYLITISDYVS